MNNNNHYDMIHHYLTSPQYDVSKHQVVLNLIHRLQQVYWHYFDHHYDPSSLPSWDTWSSQLMTAREKQEYYTYMHHLPRCGGILLNGDRTRVLLVQSKKSKQWGFPAGRPYIHETQQEASLREVQEETGYDGACSSLFLHYQSPCTCVPCTSSPGKMQKNILFVFLNVPDNFNWAPKSAEEIINIRWFHIGELRRFKLTRGWVHKIRGLLQYLSESDQEKASPQKEKQIEKGKG